MRQGDWIDWMDRPAAKAAGINGDTADPFPHWAATSSGFTRCTSLYHAAQPGAVHCNHRNLSVAPFWWFDGFAGFLSAAFTR